MGNTQKQNPANYLCNYDTPPSSVLSQTSLHPLCHKTCIKTAGLTVCSPENKENVPQTSPNTRIQLECSTQKKNIKKCPRSDTKQFLTENDFHILKVLGTEGFGKMYLVKKNDDGKLYTMKTVGKRKIANLGCLSSIESERLIFEKANHPFIPKLKYTFENDKKIFFMFDHIEGDKLNVVLHNLTKFSEEITRFYAAEIIATLGYLHKEMRTSYQDLETDHIRLDDEGHINLTDFAHAKSLDLDDISPVSKQKIEDFYHLGCLIYELLAGKKILGDEKSRQGPSLKFSLKWPKHVSRTARDLITRLLSSKAEEKLGFNDIEEIKKHPFFNGVNWDKIEHKLMYPPLSPPHKEDYKEKIENCITFSTSPYSCELDEIMERQTKNMKPVELKKRILI